MRVNERPAITNHWQQRLTTGSKQGDSNALKNNNHHHNRVDYVMPNYKQLIKKYSM